MRLLLICSAVAASAGGCATTVVPAGRIADPVSVYVADYGVHSSVMLPILLPQRSNQYVEYCFGDWRYAAENHCAPQDAVGALLASSQSAFGRRFIDVPAGGVPRPSSPPKRLMLVRAAQSNVERLEKELDERWQRDADTVVHNPGTDVDFVKDGEHYSIANNCNHMTAHLLRELGCQIHGPVGSSDFRVVYAEPAPAAVVPEQRQAAGTSATSPAADAR